MPTGETLNSINTKRIVSDSRVNITYDTMPKTIHIVAAKPLASQDSSQVDVHSRFGQSLIGKHEGESFVFPKPQGYSTVPIEVTIETVVPLQ